MQTAEEINAMAQQRRRQESLQALAPRPTLAQQQPQQPQRQPSARVPLSLAALAPKPLSGDPYSLDGSQNLFSRQALESGNANEMGQRGDVVGYRPPITPPNVSPLAAGVTTTAAPPAPVSPLASTTPGILPGGGLDNDAIAARPGTAATLSPGLSAEVFAAQSAALDRGEGLANGGIIQGRGTGTSDSNTIRVSKGEAVLPADVVAAIGGKPAIDALIAKHHKPVGARKPRGFVDGGVPLVQRVDEEQPVQPAVLPLAAGPQPRATLASVLYGDKAISALSSIPQEHPLAPRPVNLAGFVAPAQQNPLARTEINWLPKQDIPADVSPLAAAASLAPTPRPLLTAGIPNATGGQAQVRKVDNALASFAADQYVNRQIGPAPLPLANYASPSNPGNGWEGRDAIRGGAEPSTLDQGSGLAGNRGKFVSQGVGGTPGTQIVSNYGYGDDVVATADKNGKFNSFSGAGKANPLADLSSGLMRAAADREQLARIEDERNAIIMPAPSAPGQRGDERLGGGGGGGAIVTTGGRRGRSSVEYVAPQSAPQAAPDDSRRAMIEAAAANAQTAAQTRAISQKTIQDAGAQPYVQAAQAQAIQKTQADIGHTTAQTGQTQAQTGLAQEQTTAARMSNQLHTTLQGLYTKLGETKTDDQRNALKAQIATILGKEKYLLADIPVGGTNPVTGAPNTIKSPFDAEQGKFIAPPPQQMSREEYINLAKEHPDFKGKSDAALTAMYYQWLRTQR